MSDPERLLRSEERMVGTACRLVGHSALDVGGHRVELVVYETAPRKGSSHPVVQERWAVYVDGETASSSIVSTKAVEA